MKVELLRYSQDVDINDPSSALSFLVLRTDKGKEFRVQVTDTTIRDLVLALEEGKPEEVTVVPSMVVSDTSEPTEAPTENDSYYQDNQEQESEDGVPSL